MELFDLEDGLGHGDPIEEIAEFLCRDVDEVIAKEEELGFSYSQSHSALQSCARSWSTPCCGARRPVGTSNRKERWPSPAVTTARAMAAQDPASTAIPAGHPIAIIGHTGWKGDLTYHHHVGVCDERSRSIDRTVDSKSGEGEERGHMAYVDGFVLAVPKENLEAYKALARQAGDVWKEYGALAYVECVGNDVPYGELTSFPRAVQAKDDEVIIFAWIVYESREVRDAINEKVMADPRLKGDPSQMPFDAERMIYGGFETFLQL